MCEAMRTEVTDGVVHPAPASRSRTPHWRQPAGITPCYSLGRSGTKTSSEGEPRPTTPTRHGPPDSNTIPPRRPPARLPLPGKPSPVAPGVPAHWALQLTAAPASSHRRTRQSCSKSQPPPPSADRETTSAASACPGPLTVPSRALWELAPRTRQSSRRKSQPTRLQRRQGAHLHCQHATDLTRSTSRVRPQREL